MQVSRNYALLTFASAAAAVTALKSGSRTDDPNKNLVVAWARASAAPSGPIGETERAAVGGGGARISLRGAPASAEAEEQDEAAGTASTRVAASSGGARISLRGAPAVPAHTEEEEQDEPAAPEDDAADADYDEVSDTRHLRFFLHEK